MLEVLKGSEIRDKAAFLRPQYSNLYNKAFTGGTEYSLEDSLSVVIREAEGETAAGPSNPSNQIGPEAANSGPSETEPGTSESDPGTSGGGILKSVSGTSSTVPKSSGGGPNVIGQRKKASWRGGKDRSTEVRILNPLGIPVEMLEFKPRDDESYKNKRWTYVLETDSSESDGSDGDDDEGQDGGGVDRRKSPVKRKRGRPRKEERAGTGEGDAQNSAGDGAGDGAGDPNGLQEMTDLLNTDQYAFVTEEEFATKGNIYLQAMTEAHTESDGHLDPNQLVDSDQYVFVARDDFATEDESFIQDEDKTGRAEIDESQETSELDDIVQSTAINDYVSLELESARTASPSALLESEEYEMDDQDESIDSSEKEGSASEIDQSEVTSDGIGQSDLMDDNIDHSDTDVAIAAVPLERHQATEVIPVQNDVLEDQLQSDFTLNQGLPEGETLPSLPAMNNQSPVAIDAIGQSELRSSCQDSMEVLTAISLSSNQAPLYNPIQENATQVLSNHPLVSAASPARRMDDANVPRRSTPVVLPSGSEAPGTPVRFRLHQKENPSNESFSKEPPCDSNLNTIPLADAINRGVVSSDQSDDQLLTIDVSQLGPDSNIVIPSYLLPGGILTIRSPDVPFMRIQRSDPSSLVQIGTDAASASNALDVSSQSQVEVAPTSQSLDDVSEDCGPGSDVESAGEDEISQTEYVVASDQPVKESQNLCEVHVIANHILKPSNQAEVSQKTSPKALHITKRSGTSPKEQEISKKSGVSNQPEGMQSEGVEPEMEEMSFLDFLSSQKPAWSWREKSTTPRGLPLKDIGLGDPEVEGLNVQVQAVHNVNIPQGISQHAIPGEPVEGQADIVQENVSVDLTPKEKPKRGRPPKNKLPTKERSSMASHMQQDSSASASPQGKRKRGRPRKTDTKVSVGVVDFELEREETQRHIAKDLDGQETFVATDDGSDHVTERVVGEKRKRGRPPKKAGSKAGIHPQEDRQESQLVEDICSVDHHVSMSSVRSAGQAQEDILRNNKEKFTSILELMNKPGDMLQMEVQNEKRKRGSPLKAQSAGASQQLQNPQHSPKALFPSFPNKEKSNKGILPTVPSDVLQREVPNGHSEGFKRIVNQSGVDFSAESPQKRKRGRPSKGSNVNLSESLERTAGFEQLGTDSEVDSGTEKRKRGRPRKVSISDSLDDNLQAEVKPSQSTEREEDVALSGIDSGTESKEKRKRGRPRKEKQSGFLDDLEDSPITHLTENKEKRKRGRPRKETQPSSLNDLQDGSVICQLAVSEIGNGQLETDAMTETTEKKKRGRPCKESRSDPRNDFPNEAIASQSTGNEARTEQFESDVEAEKKRTGKVGSPFKGFSPYQPNVSNSRSGNGDKLNRGRPSEGVVPGSCTNLSPRVMACTSTVESRLERLTELSGGPLKDKSRACILEKVHREEKQKRGRPPKESRTESVVGLEDAVVTHQPVENEICIGQSETVSWVEMEVKGKKGRSHKESRPDSFDDLPNVIIPRQATENIEGVKPLEAEPRTATEEAERRGNPPSGFGLYQSKQLGRTCKELQVDPCSGPQSKGLQGCSREHETNDSHVAQQQKQKIISPQKEQTPGCSRVVHTKQAKTHSVGKDTSVSQTKSPAEGGEKRKRGRPRKAGKPDTDAGSEKLEKRKRGRPSKTVATGSPGIHMESSVHKSQSPEKDASMKHTQTESRIDDVEEPVTDGTFKEAGIGSTNECHHELDVPRSVNSDGSTNTSVSDTGQEIEENATRPHDSHEFGSASEETSVTRPIPTGELVTDKAVPEVRKQVSLDRYLSSKESGTHQAQGKSILKKPKKRSPLKVNVGKALADKRQRSLDRKRLSQTSTVLDEVSPFDKPLASMFPESDLLFGKPKKRVSFEDAIDLVNTLGEREVLEKDLLMTDIVSQTAMKEVMKIVQEVGVQRESIVELQPRKKTSIFFSIKKS